MNFQARPMNMQANFLSTDILLSPAFARSFCFWPRRTTLRRHGGTRNGPFGRRSTSIPRTAGAPIADPIGTTAILIRLHDGNFRFAEAKEDGSDIRFVADDEKTLLSYHIEKYDALLNEAFVWVKLPDLKAGHQDDLLDVLR